jgi:hypothetical protein
MAVDEQSNLAVELRQFALSQANMYSGGSSMTSDGRHSADQVVERAKTYYEFLKMEQTDA